MVATNSIAEVYSMQLVKANVTMEPELALLFHTYNDVFDTPILLPPPRSHDHHIPLLEAYQPVKVKPFGYPYP